MTISSTHYTVLLYGTGAYDGIRASIFVLNVIPTTNMMQSMARRNKHTRNLFLSPSIDCPERTTTPTYDLRCYGKDGEIGVPPLSAFAAAHVLIALHDIDGITTVVIFEGSRKLEFPVSSSRQIKCIIELAPVVSFEALHMERIVLLDLFKIIRRGLTLNYVEAHKTLVVYDNQSTVSQLRNLVPRSASYTENAIEQLQIATIIVCVNDELSGGIFARAFLPAQDYAEATMPVAATPYLQSCCNSDHKGSVLEISWITASKRCYLVAQATSTNSTTLIAQAASSG
ncbi:hypothetical protein H4R20_001024 [Coemansia guatemalensis]|uniref:Uncharacterized protein n=1 Tax=Coemansia guatemalensis TaxID=2761395 RepID=A0A9W8HXU0_9FUNG|nr:hypothetical protein H4R20_001024 [Coemansia guatemalensis]